VHEEGWYVDPFGHHESRWMSDGAPTALVRDGWVESQDPPTDANYSGPLQPVADESPGGSEDLRRADSSQEDSASVPSKKEQFMKVARVVLNPGDTDVW